MNEDTILNATPRPDFQMGPAPVASVSDASGAYFPAAGSDDQVTSAAGDQMLYVMDPLMDPFLVGVPGAIDHVDHGAQDMMSAMAGANMQQHHLLRAGMDAGGHSLAAVGGMPSQEYMVGMQLGQDMGLGMGASVAGVMDQQPMHFHPQQQQQHIIPSSSAPGVSFVDITNTATAGSNSSPKPSVTPILSYTQTTTPTPSPQLPASSTRPTSTLPSGRPKKSLFINTSLTASANAAAMRNQHAPMSAPISNQSSPYYSVISSMQSPTRRRRGDHSTSGPSGEAITFFGQTKQLVHILSRDQSRSYNVTINPKIDRGFFFTENDWTCYRRNYFQLTCAFSSLDENGNALELPCVMRDPKNPDVLHQVTGFCVSMGARVANGEKIIEIVQHTPKRDKGPQTVPTAQPILPGGNPFDFAGAATANPSVVTFERCQFKSATANSVKRKAALKQYYVIVVELIAVTATGLQIPAARIESLNLVVRGRSPSHYNDNSQGNPAGAPMTPGGPTSAPIGPPPRRFSSITSATGFEGGPSSDFYGMPHYQQHPHLGQHGLPAYAQMGHMGHPSASADSIILSSTPTSHPLRATSSVDDLGAAASGNPLGFPSYITSPCHVPSSPFSPSVQDGSAGLYNYPMNNQMWMRTRTQSLVSVADSDAASFTSATTEASSYDSRMDPQNGEAFYGASTPTHVAFADGEVGPVLDRRPSFLQLPGRRRGSLASLRAEPSPVSYLGGTTAMFPGQQVSQAQGQQQQQQQAHDPSASADYSVASFLTSRRGSIPSLNAGPPGAASKVLGPRAVPTTAALDYRRGSLASIHEHFHPVLPSRRHSHRRNLSDASTTSDISTLNSSPYAHPFSIDQGSPPQTHKHLLSQPQMSGVGSSGGVVASHPLATGTCASQKEFEVAEGAAMGANTFYDGGFGVQGLMMGELSFNGSHEFAGGAMGLGVSSQKIQGEGAISEDAFAAEFMVGTRF
ncbi:hypothetical protein HK101_001121 [Irineochytrium annulatum]|nr:hypothetical protein HK101_001121 [Irineochytrium annulatum]